MRKPPSDRSLGLVTSVVLAVVGLAPLVRGEPPRVWAIAALGVVLALALAAPRWLGPLNFVLMRVGRGFGAVVLELALLITFFFVVTPLGVVARWTGRDIVGRRFPGKRSSYWAVRACAAPPEIDLGRPY